MRMTLVLDWDGTVTDGDTLHAAIAEFGDVDVFRAMEDEIGRRLTLQEVIAVEMATISAPVDEVVAFLLDTVSLRAGFPEIVERYDPLVVSMGFHELIAPLLERDGIGVRVVANRLDPRPEGWGAVFRQQATCAVCGEPLQPGWHADHVRPVSAGGETGPANGQALCARCNLAKGARPA